MKRCETNKENKKLSRRVLSLEKESITMASAGDVEEALRLPFRETPKAPSEPAERISLFCLEVFDTLDAFHPTFCENL